MLKRVKGFTLIELLIVVAIIAILAAIAVPNFLEAQTRSKVSRVRSDLRSYATAIESYYVDNNSYPVWSSSATANDYGANNQPQISTTPPSARFTPTFRVKGAESGGDPDMLATLTTPVAYITSHFADPFADSKGAIFCYTVGGFFNEGWIMWSYGPDTDEKVGWTQLTDPNADTPDGTPSTDAGGDIAVVVAAPGPVAETTYYNPGSRIPSTNLLLVTYDPTNGTSSNGDVYRVKQ